MMNDRGPSQLVDELGGDLLRVARTIEREAGGGALNLR